MTRRGNTPPSYYAATAAPLAAFPAAAGRDPGRCLHRRRRLYRPFGGAASGRSAAIAWCCWRRIAWALAPRAATAGRSAPASGRIRSDLEKIVGRENAAPPVGPGRRGQGAGARPDRRPRHAGAPSTPASPMPAGPTPRCATAHAYAEKLHRDYGYDQLEPLDRDGIRAPDRVAGL